MTLNLRPAGIDDAVNAAYLLAETTGQFGVEALGLGKPELQIAAFQQWFIERGNRFSYECCTIAEVNGTTAGLLLAFTGAKLNRLEFGCAKSMFAIYGFLGAFKMIWLNKSLTHNKEAEKDEYLIAHLAVDDHFRRQGVGQALLAKAEEDARSLGLNRLVLEVEIGNNNAFSLYQKTGFDIVNTVYFNDKADQYKCPGFYKMSKNL